jgi:hypothetical protein
VLDVQDHLTPRELIVFARSLLMGRPEGSLEFISGLIDTRPDLRVSLLSLVADFGSSGLRVLEDRLNRDSGEDNTWLLSLIGAIGSVRHPRAQDILKRFETSSDRLVWRFARENIRLVEQRMLKSALSAYRRPSGSVPTPK